MANRKDQLRGESLTELFKCAGASRLSGFTVRGHRAGLNTGRSHLKTASLSARKNIIQQVFLHSSRRGLFSQHMLPKQKPHEVMLP